MSKETVNITSKRTNEDKHALLVTVLCDDGYSVKTHTYNRQTINTVLEK